MVIAREGSEGCDVKTCNAHDSIKTNSNNKAVSQKHALELSDNEQALFDLLHDYFDHIIIIINSSNVFECDVFEKDPAVSGILWIGNPGDVGPLAIGRILCGEVNPSGHTVDTWARDFTKDPTFVNFSDNAQMNYVDYNGDKYYIPQDTMLNADGTMTRSYGTNKNYNNTANPSYDNNRGGAEYKVPTGGLNGVKPASYVSYEEGIYVDYRYYETRYADLAKDDKKAADDWYDGEDGVVYPFGYGLSYTTFDQSIVRIAPANNSVLSKDNDIIDVTVKVTNTGKVTGKDAVQLYWKAPYFEGEIEKADHILCAFDKTDDIEPGKSQYVQLSFHLQDVANYDFSDANNNGFKGYELDGGEYQLSVNKNAHKAYGHVNFTIAEGGITYRNDRFTGNPVENRFTDRGFLSSMPEGDLEFTQFSRADFEGTFPTTPDLESRKLSSNSKYETFLTHEFSLANFEKGVEDEYNYMPRDAKKTEQDFVANGWEQKSKSPRTQLSAMREIPYDDPKWDEFMNEFTYDEMVSIVRGSSRNTSSVSSVGKGTYNEGDGPQKFSTIWWVSSPIIAATFNPRLAHEQGECCGMEAHIDGKSGWWGPAVNTHRSPFGGRNFEYYSADPFLMGRMAANVVGAAADRGLYAYFKHFAVNDQEKNRESGISFVNEQALREIYLKSFQMVFEEGKSIGVMGSYNRLGLMETAASYPLMTEVLRGEWGFKGSVLSDMTHSGNSSVNFRCYETVDNRAVAGCNCQLDSGGFKNYTECKWDDNAFGGKGAPTSTYKAPDGTETEFTSYTWWNAVRERVKEHLYMSVNCNGVLKPANYYVGVVGSEYKFYEARTEIEEYEITIEGAETIELNNRVELPRGIKFADGKLTGKFELEGIYHLDFIGRDADGKAVGAFKLIARATTGAEQNFVKGGCSGDIAACGAIIGLIAVAGAGLLLVSLRKKKEA